MNYLKYTGYLCAALMLACCAIAPKPTENFSSHNHLNKRLLETKQAILNLDSTRIESLTNDIDVNALLPDNSSLLSWAVETQEPAHVALLLEKGAKLRAAETNRFTPLIIACTHGNSTIINLLLKHGANPNVMLDDNTTAFQLCAGSTKVSMLDEMLGLGADLNHVNAKGQTALMWAANYGLMENIQKLIANGANINQQTNEGFSPLFFAIRNHKLEAAQFLLREGANILAQTNDGTTAAQLAVYAKNYNFLVWLTENLPTLMTPEAMHATLNAFDRNGHQLLHAAVLANRPVLVSALLRQGAKINEVSGPSRLTWRYEANFKTQDYDPPRLTPLEFAKKHKFEQIISLLDKHEYAIRN